MAVPTTTLNDGNEIPVLAFGTGSKFKGKDVTDVVEQALEAGFSHIDSAAIYANEQYVGAAIHESGLARQDIWITTKYDGGDPLDAVHTSLRKLGVRYLDLYLIHSPFLIGNGDIESLWDNMIKIRGAGLTRSIGVSNFTIGWLQRIVKTGKVVPAVNQIHLHPYNYASWKDVLEFCAKHDIVTEAYGCLAPITTYPDGPLDPVLAAIAHRIGGSPAQVIFKWAHAKGFVVVTTTARRTHLDDYLRVIHLRVSLPRSPFISVSADVVTPDRFFFVADLTPEEVATIDKAGAQGPPVPAQSTILSCPKQLHAYLRIALGIFVILFAIVLCRRLVSLALSCMH
ncbi:NADP-dependent oxidoreductase domain-containing protein [Russula earlei]|uniref:NADP-dependent oxidoreductase domain-containing protein n=1 Tax=Russula earlei TaxID=71964 RepID=A0ACC0UGM5_9AGAM|nr:NADP-dependent oxidoreductase domain-containing protein [Russula earlei]